MEKLGISIVEELTSSLDADAPCGPNLEYDADFLAFEQAARGKPENQIGEHVTEAVPPEWKDVLPQALELLRRSRDLRVGVPFARGLLHLQGIFGFAIGLRLIEVLLDEYWDSVHPQLDADDDNDPTMRVNTIAALRERGGLLQEFRAAPLVELRALGRFSTRDIDLASGEIETPEGVQAPSSSTIDSVFAEVDLAELGSTLEALDSIVSSITNIENCIMQQAGAMFALDLSEARRTFQHARDIVAARYARRGGNAEQALADGEAAAGPGAANGVAGVPGQIGSRPDVLQAIDRICDYYNKFEPSSPVPLLLQRAQRLVDKNFLELLEDLAPEGLSQAHHISGTPPPNNE